MRVTLVATVLVGILIGVFAPIPFLTIGTPPADGALPSFAETRDRIGKRDTEPPPPAYGENPERRKVRKAVLDAAYQLEFDPCSEDLRKKLAAAVRRFAESIDTGPQEVALVNGKEKNVSKKYDEPASDAVFKALMKGHIEPADLVGPWRRAFVKARSSGFPGSNPCAG